MSYTHETREIFELNLFFCNLWHLCSLRLITGAISIQSGFNLANWLGEGSGPALFKNPAKIKVQD